jgi:hypothetical protein
MQALFLDEDIAFFGLIAIHHRQLLFAGISDLFQRVVILDIRNEIIVRHGAGHFAGSAADTPGGIDKHADEFLWLFCGVGLQIAVGYASRGNGRRSQQKLSSIHDRSYLEADHWRNAADQNVFFPE